MERQYRWTRSYRLGHNRKVKGLYLQEDMVLFVV